MPAKNVVKTYINNGIYHIYNRGVEKRKIFQDKQDYNIFLNYIKEYLSPPPDISQLKTQFILQGETFKGLRRLPRNYYKKITLIAYCLLPNHFHLLINQNSTDDMQEFIRSLCTRYSIYFNKKYDRVGGLFQGPYKAVIVTEDNYLLHLSRYIHLNPKDYTKDIINTYSSYAEYMGLRRTEWVKPDIVLGFFNNPATQELIKTNNYRDFVEKYIKDSEAILGNMTLE